ncbi:MAG: GntR family transcriptional regulator [Deltaproteobacteria bacterium]|nr:MAG: GntR family transcriptional regulator [Deltaproteobacteria bacterium]
MAASNKPNKEKEWNRLEIKSLTAVVLDDIRMRILTGDFRPGERINESEIALNLSISRSPVREAFRVLEGEGLITTLPRKGSFITDISAQDVEELFEIREILECHAIDCIKKRAKKSPDEVKALTEEIGRQLLRKPDTSPVISGFHFNLVGLSNNYRLIELYKILGVSLRRYQLIYLSRKGQRDVALEHHQVIVDALKRGNYSDIKKLLKKHIRYVENTVKKQIKGILSDE